MPAFVPGLTLARAFYEEVVAPLVNGVEHSAALLGTGSDVLGFDTERSTDHAWGPRLQVFVAGIDVAEVQETIEKGLPDEFGGWPTRFGWDAVPVTHHVEIHDLDDWLLMQIGFDPLGDIATSAWLGVPQQVLLEVTTGAVFHDGLGQLVPAREALAWYPDDVWLWLLASQWRRIDQEEPFVGRAAEVGDELGSRIVAARLVRDVMRLCFLQERQYAPYSKWLGSAFRRLVRAARRRPAEAPGGDRLRDPRSGARRCRTDGCGAAQRARDHRVGRREHGLLPRPAVPRPRLRPLRRRLPRARLRSVATDAAADGRDRPVRGLDGRPLQVRRFPAHGSFLRALVDARCEDGGAAAELWGLGARPLARSNASIDTTLR